MFLVAMVPPGLEKREGIFQSGNVDKTGKVREFYSKYWKNEKFNQECLLVICPQKLLAFAFINA